MIFLNIEPGPLSNHNLDKLITYMNKGKDIYILIYMDGCGPCNATKPEWKKIKNVMKGKSSSIVVVELNRSLLKVFEKYLLNPVMSFPTILHIYNGGKIQESYEDASLTMPKNRSIDSFVEWIKKTSSKTSKAKTVKLKMKEIKHVIKGGKKWSLKYKRSINCRNPKGFSQKQYCNGTH